MEPRQCGARAPVSTVTPGTLRLGALRRGRVPQADVRPVSSNTCMQAVAFEDTVLLRHVASKGFCEGPDNNVARSQRGSRKAVLTHARTFAASAWRSVSFKSQCQSWHSA
jgi:hypothetical protein